LRTEQTALVIGGSGYIGSETVALLSQAGMRVILTYHQGKAQAERLSQQYKCSAYQLDLNIPQAVSHLFENLRRDQVIPQTVVLCAASSQYKAFDDLNDQDWENLLRINCQSLFNTCQALYRLAKEQPNSVQNIIALSAINQKQSFELPLHFAASQGAINQFVASASKLFGPLGARINVVVPGMLEKGLSDSFSQQLRQDFIQFSALGRLGKASEVARCITWLATNNTYISGQCIPVNGGI